MIGNQPNEKRGGKEGASEECHDVLAQARVAKERETKQDDAKREERVYMKERHRGVQRELDPEWQPRKHSG